MLNFMGKKSDDKASESTSESEAPTTETQAATPPPPATPSSPATASSSGRKGVIAAIAAGTGVAGVLIGLFVGWIAFDHEGGKDGRGDRDRMGQMQQQRPGMDGERRDGRMMPGGGEGGRPGRGQVDPGAGTPPSVPSPPSTQSSVTPQSLEQS
jgi:hypothetical protein